MKHVYGIPSISFAAAETEPTYIIVDEFDPLIADNIRCRLESAAKQLSSPIIVVTPEEIVHAAEAGNVPLEDLLTLIERVAPPKHTAVDFNKIALTAELIEPEKAQKVYSNDHDDRPWYEKAQTKGGKKRKHNYFNKNCR